MVEWDGFENRCTGNGTGGSNPTLSAIKAYYQLFTRLSPNFTPNNVRLGVFLLTLIRQYFLTQPAQLLFHFNSLMKRSI